jgi:hypothetical protein
VSEEKKATDSDIKADQIKQQNLVKDEITIQLETQ